MLPFRGLSVTFVLCAQTTEDIDTISFAYKGLMSLPDHVKIIGQPLPPQILPQSQSDPPHVYLSLEWQIAAEWLDIAQSVMEPGLVFESGGGAGASIPYERWSKCTMEK